MTIRIEISRKLGCKQGKGRNRINPNIVSLEPTVGEAVAYIAAIRDGGEAVAPGYMPITGARLYDLDAFNAWVKAGGTMPAPLEVLTADEVAAIPSAPAAKDEAFF